MKNAFFKSGPIVKSLNRLSLDPRKLTVASSKDTCAALRFTHLKHSVKGINFSKAIAQGISPDDLATELVLAMERGNIGSSVVNKAMKHLKSKVGSAELKQVKPSWMDNIPHERLSEDIDYLIQLRKRTGSWRT